MGHPFAPTEGRMRRPSERFFLFGPGDRNHLPRLGFRPSEKVYALFARFV
jgi:hypothetical protein